LLESVLVAGDDVVEELEVEDDEASDFDGSEDEDGVELLPLEPLLLFPESDPDFLA
jgi:hypothetical protein